MGNANLLEVARGAIGERLDYELSKVVDNIADLNTKADAVRKITLTLSDEGKALVEMLPQVPGQMALDGSEQDEPKVIAIKKAM